MDGLIDIWMDGQIYGWMYRYMDEQIDIWMDRQIKRRICQVLVHLEIVSSDNQDTQETREQINNRWDMGRQIDVLIEK